ncbi:hypothetical protein Pden_0354 [Paracoccus denitrificans PD1222]|uniref:Uncharacterized protein n=1 Tax=Paracoccus denitrificans (strain Pd 1222) TaxID=318586 RepID=A1AYX4_PARDP|nr:hypothetical protein Pden_0354 [Paracoccus denitrificans PD1222]
MLRSFVFKGLTLFFGPDGLEGLENLTFTHEAFPPYPAVSRACVHVDFSGPSGPSGPKIGIKPLILRKRHPLTPEGFQAHHRRPSGPSGPTTMRWHKDA